MIIITIEWLFTMVASGITLILRLPQVLVPVPLLRVLQQVQQVLVLVPVHQHRRVQVQVQQQHYNARIHTKTNIRSTGNLRF
jgi:predicted Co/Zn/Cd cation transporter (cation efflux family)